MITRVNLTDRGITLKAETDVERDVLNYLLTDAGHSDAFKDADLENSDLICKLRIIAPDEISIMPRQLVKKESS